MLHTKERERRGCLAVGVFACLNLFHLTAGVEVLTKAPCLPLDSSPFFFASEDLPKPRRRHVQCECQCFDKKLTSVCKNRKYTDQLFFYTPSAVSAKQTSASLSPALEHKELRGRQFRGFRTSREKDSEDHLNLQQKTNDLLTVLLYFISNVSDRFLVSFRPQYTLA